MNVIEANGAWIPGSGLGTIAVFDFSVRDEEMATIGHLAERADGRAVNPPHAPAWDA
jgi:hypothetical protein